MESQTTSVHTDEFAKLSWKERICYGSGDLAQNLIFGTIGSMLLFYMTTVFGPCQSDIMKKGKINKMKHTIPPTIINFSSF